MYYIMYVNAYFLHSLVHMCQFEESTPWNIPSHICPQLSTRLQVSVARLIWDG